MSDRFSKDFLNYRGAEKQNVESGGNYVASFSDNKGTEKAPPPSNQFLVETDKESGSINYRQFYAVMGIIQNRGSSETSARYNALALQDMAEGNNTTAMKLLFNSDLSGSRISYRRDIYSDMNMVRDASNQIDLTQTTQNEDSFQSRNILA